jgi:hypothetical protein
MIACSHVLYIAESNEKYLRYSSKAFDIKVLLQQAICFVSILNRYISQTNELIIKVNV